MDIKEIVLVALEGIWVNKLRSFLTMLGIIIGVSAVIAVVAIGQGGKSAIVTSLEKLGTNLFVVHLSNRNTNEPITRADYLTEEDSDAIENLISTVKHVSPVSWSSTLAEYGRKKQSVFVAGTNPGYKQIRNLTLVKGRFYSDNDFVSARRVVVIPHGLEEELFGHEDSIGKQIYFRGVPLVVVGVIEEPKLPFDMGNSSYDVYVPLTAFRSVFNFSRIHQIEASAIDKEHLQEAIDQTVKVLHRRHNNQDKYRAFNLNDEVKQANSILGVMATVIGSIAGVSLVVGGIGVMNIMLVSVTERTREIGIRKALGATRRDILIQFLIEAVVICLIGGAIGVLVGGSFAFIVAKFAKWPPLISFSTVLIAFFFSAAVGIFFGIYPANKAAKLDPIEALRYE